MKLIFLSLILFLFGCSSKNTICYYPKLKQYKIEDNIKIYPKGYNKDYILLKKEDFKQLIYKYKEIKSINRFLNKEIELYNNFVSKR